MSEEDREATPGAEELPPYRIEPARSSRSGCKTCRRKIQKGALRFGVRVEGPFGAGFLWHHLTCAARRRMEEVEEAYGLESWEPGTEVPPLSELEQLREKADQERKKRKQPPFAERAPSGRSRCKQCGEPIVQDGLRVGLPVQVEFGRQVRINTILVHPGCVAQAAAMPDSAVEPGTFGELLRANTSDLDGRALDDVLAQVGELG